MGLNEPHKPPMCRNIVENYEKGEEMAKLLGFFRDLAKWTGMPIFYSI